MAQKPPRTEPDSGCTVPGRLLCSDTAAASPPACSLCSGNGGRRPVHHRTVDSPSAAALPQNAPGPLMRPTPEAPAPSGRAIKPNKAQGAPWGAHGDAHSNWPRASGSPGVKDYVLAAGKGQGRVKTLREARWDHLASCISHEQPW